MTTAGQRYFSAGVLLLWGGALAYFYFSGLAGSYLHPSFRIWTGVSGIVLVLMALGVVVLRGSVATCSHDHGHDQAHDHGHAHDHGECCDHHHHAEEIGPRLSWGRISAAFVLTVPLVFAMVFSRHEFSAAWVTNRGLVEDAAKLPGYTPYAEPALPTADGTPDEAAPVQTEPHVPRNAAGQIQAETVDLLYAAQDDVMREDFENQAVELIGQMMPATANNPAGNRFRLVRMFIRCCAADAQPVAVTVQSAQPPSVPEMGWIRVTGKATFPVEGGRRVPVVVADSVTPSDPPQETLIY